MRPSSSGDHPCSPPSGKQALRGQAHPLCLHQAINKQIVANKSLLAGSEPYAEVMSRLCRKNMAIYFGNETHMACMSLANLIRQADNTCRGHQSRGGCTGQFCCCRQRLQHFWGPGRWAGRSGRWSRCSSVKQASRSACLPSVRFSWMQCLFPAALLATLRGLQG